jgi:hypothetical protein
MEARILEGVVGRLGCEAADGPSSLMAMDEGGLYSWRRVPRANLQQRSQAGILGRRPKGLSSLEGLGHLVAECQVAANTPTKAHFSANPDRRLTLHHGHHVSWDLRTQCQDLPPDGKSTSSSSPLLPQPASNRSSQASAAASLPRSRTSHKPATRYRTVKPIRAVISD